MSEGRVHELLDSRHAAITGRQLQDAPATLGDPIANPPVRADVGAAEPIDGLLRIADDEEPAGHVVGQEQEDLRLNRIGVLKLVDEDPRELLLQVMADAVVGPDEIPRARQQVGEIERAGRFLERLITRRRAGELLLQARRKIGIRVLSELLEVAQQRVVRSQHVRARGVLAELVADSLPRAREAAIARQIDEARLPAVEINLSE